MLSKFFEPGRRVDALRDNPAGGLFEGFAQGSLASGRPANVLRHTCALTVLQATKDLRKVSLWLGHTHMETTEMYTRVDPSVKLEALESVMPPTLRSGRFKTTDKLIASLTSGSFMRSKN